MADEINLSFPDESYSTSNPPSAVTLKTDLTTIETEHNQMAGEVNDHETRVDALEADVVDVRGGQEGLLINGKIVTSVASNNLTVAVKTLAGADPSASDPVYVRIGNTVRTITAALSVTKAAGTNWFDAGGTETATKEIDFFVYLIWNTTGATDIVDIGFSRIPYATLYSDFSATTTNYAYLAIGTGDVPTSTDEVRVAGRFNAILGVTASFNWSIPATSIIVQYPIFETRALSWSPVETGYTGSNTYTSAHYTIRGRHVFVGWQGATNAAKGGGAGTVTFTVPIPFKYAHTLTALVNFYSAAYQWSAATVAAGSKQLTVGQMALSGSAIGGTITASYGDGLTLGWASASNEIFYEI